MIVFHKCRAELEAARLNQSARAICTFGRLRQGSKATREHDLQLFVSICMRGIVSA